MRVSWILVSTFLAFYNKRQLEYIEIKQFARDFYIYGYVDIWYFLYHVYILYTVTCRDQEESPVRVGDFPLRASLKRDVLYGAAYWMKPVL